MTKMTKKTKRTIISSLIFGGIILLATIAVMTFIPTERRLSLEIGALVVGLGVGTYVTRFGVPAQWQRWISPIALLLFIATWLALGTAGYAWFGGVLSGVSIGFAWAHATKQLTIKSVRNEIISAIAEVRRVAQTEQDESRSFTADYLDREFAKANDLHSLRAASTDALKLYGGWGSFSDVGSAESARAVDSLYGALRRGRSLFLRNS